MTNCIEKVVNGRLYFFQVLHRGPEYIGNRPLGWYVDIGEIKNGYCCDLVNGYNSQQAAIQAAVEKLEARK